MMTSLQNLHTAIGELAYAVARADGTIQKEEREKFHDLVSEELKSNNYDFDISDIIFQVLDRDKYVDAKTSYDWAIKEIRLNSHYLSPELKQKFINVMEKVAQAYPPVTYEETTILEKFKKDIDPLIGDPVYYQPRNRSQGQ
jgi:uncharacterized tellurite resistance protein B-like protein